jgi:hypothetical protein
MNHAKHAESALEWRFSARPSLWHYAIAYGTIANICDGGCHRCGLAGLPVAVATVSTSFRFPTLLWLSSAFKQPTNRGPTGRHRQRR